MLVKGALETRPGHSIQSGFFFWVVFFGGGGFWGGQEEVGLVLVVSAKSDNSLLPLPHDIKLHVQQKSTRLDAKHGTYLTLACIES